MRNGFRQSMAWLHTWAGLVVGWVLFAVFVTGTASYYQPAISRWMRPELRREVSVPTPAELAAAADHAVAYLRAQAPNARSWFVTLPRPDRPVVELFWRTRPGTPPGRALLDPRTGEPAAVRDTRGGEFLYRFHFELHMPPIWGRWIVGICAMIMLLALVSGVITHRRIFADFFTFRRDKSAQRGWLDAHNVTGVLALPFHLMITYTGVVTLALMYMPWGVTAAYQGDTGAFYAESGQVTAARPPTGRPGTLAPVGPMVERAIAAIPGSLERLSILNPRDAGATVVAVFEEPRGLSHEHPQVAFDGVGGAVVEVRAGGLAPAAKTFTTMVGLHEAHFATAGLRVLFFLCGVLGSVMVASGLVLWTVARAPKPGERPVPGLGLVRVLNVGTIAGLPGAIAAYFLANRLLPLGLADRADGEVRVFFAAWVALALIAPAAAALARPHRAAWRVALATVAALYAAVPIVDVLTTEPGAAGGWTELPWRELPWRELPWRELPWMTGFGATMLALSAAFAVASRQVARYAAPRRAGGARTARSAAPPSPAVPAPPGAHRPFDAVRAPARVGHG